MIGMSSSLWVRIKKSNASPECRAYINHIMSCSLCNAAVSRYCDDGFNIWAAYQVPLRVESIILEPELRQRQALIASAPIGLRDMVSHAVLAAWNKKNEADWLCR